MKGINIGYEIRLICVFTSFRPKDNLKTHVVLNDNSSIPDLYEARPEGSANGREKGTRKIPIA